MRIIVASVPRMLSDLLKHAIDESPDIELVATLAQGEDPRPTMLWLDPDVVVVGDTTGDGDHAVAALRLTSPRIRVVRLSPTGRSATIHGLGDDVVVLDDVSVGALLQLLRTVSP